jgi:hypothetical protein
MRMQRHWFSMGGALAGILEALGRPLPLPYLMGVSGLAFRLTLDLPVTPQSVHEWSYYEMAPLWEQLRLWLQPTAARREDDHFSETHRKALERIERSVGSGRPAAVFGLLEIPEWGLVTGVRGAAEVAALTLANLEEPRWQPWSAVPPPGLTWARLDVLTVVDAAPDFDRRTVEVASLRYALAHAWAPESADGWLRHGLRAYEFWAGSLASPLPMHGENPGIGHSFNLAVLRQLRSDAAAYLAGLAEHYPEAPSLRRASALYGETAATLGEGSAAYPFPGRESLENRPLRDRLAALLRQAREREAAALGELEQALRDLR